MNDTKRTAAFFVFPFLCGFLGAGSQIVLLREFLVFCGGNEFTVGVFFGCWLALGGLGSAIGTLSASRLRHREVAVLCALFGLLGLFLPVAMPLFVELRRALGMLPGEILSPAAVLATVVVVLFPVVTTLGYCFALSYQVYSRERSAEIDDIGRTYLWDAIGSLAAGVLISFFLLFFFNSLGNMLLLAGVTWILLAVAAFRNAAEWGRISRILAFASPVVILGLGTLLVWHAELGARLVQRLWPGYRVMSSRDSLYGNITLLTRQGQASLFYNGGHLSSSDDRLHAQELVHETLLQHPDPKTVLLLGGGAAGFIPEILRHPVERLEVVELDPLLLRTCQLTFPEDFPSGAGRATVHFSYVDARAFVSRAVSRYDAIVVSLPDPSTVQLARLYTVEFLDQLRAHLNPGGLVAFGVSGDDAFLSPPLEAYLRNFYAGMGRVFPNVKIIPGSCFIFLGGESAKVPANDVAAMRARLIERQVKSDLVNGNYLAQRLEKWRIGVFEAKLSRRGPITLNTDLHPSLPWFCVSFWRQKFSLHARLANFGGERKLAAGFMILLLLVANGAVYGWRKRTASILPLVGLNGLNGLGLQVLALLAFQTLFGLVYFGCALLITLFMLGLSIGVMLYLRRGTRESADPTAFVWSQVSIALAYLVFPFLIRNAVALNSSGILGGGVLALFMLMAFGTGVLVGFQFLACCGLAHARGAVAVWESDVFLYALNLAGGCVGALLISPVLIPLFGYLETTLFLALLNLGPALIMRFGFPRNLKAGGTFAA